MEPLADDLRTAFMDSRHLPDLPNLGHRILCQPAYRTHPIMPISHLPLHPPLPQPAMGHTRLHSDLRLRQLRLHQAAIDLLSQGWRRPPMAYNMPRLY